MANIWAVWSKKNPGVATLMLAAIIGALLLSPVARAQQVMMSDGSMAPDTDPSQDPPSQVARISALDGTVSYEPASVNDFAAAEMNYPLTTGDRLYADASSDAEFQTGNLAVRLGAYTDLTVTALTDTLTQLGLAQGSVHLRTNQLDNGSTVELDTPNVAVTVLAAGDVRVETDPNSDTTLVTVFSGQAEIDGNGIQLTLEAGQSVQLRGSQPVAAQWMRTEPQDALDAFSVQRDSEYANALAAQANDLSPETIGADDLSQNGQWQNDASYGTVWYPNGVAVDWEPYRNGHWVWIAPWGWTWVPAERWGFAPFHYGRWAHIGRRWGWIPGPPVVRPVWSPALVVFVGAPGVTAWFPLGPREPFVPWYHASTLYVNRVNVTNIYNRNYVQVRSSYNQRATNLYPGQPINRGYANRQLATVAMSQEAFAAGRPVNRNSLRGPQPQLSSAPIVPHPLVTPQRTMVTSTPARALPPRFTRPTLASRQDTRITPPPVAPGHEQSVGGLRGPQRTGPIQGVPPAPITRNPPTVPPPNPIHGQPPVQGKPTANRPTLPVNEPNPTHGQPPLQGNPPATKSSPVQPPNPTHAQPPVQGNPPATKPKLPVNEPNPTHGQPPVQGNPTRVPPRTLQPTPAPPQQLAEPAPTRPPTPPRSQPPAQQPDRPLFNKAVPPEPRPSFEKQQQAIEKTDPGRPLSPSQMQNVRQNQPVGPAQQHEAAHPTPAPAPKAAPQTPAKPDDKKK